MNILSIFNSSLSLMAPLLFASLGCLIMQKAGVINLGVDGIMLLGGLLYGVLIKDWFIIWDKIIFLSFFLVFLLGLALGFIHSFLTITLKVNQFLVSFIWNFLALGLLTIILSLKYNQFNLDYSSMAIIELTLMGSLMLIIFIFNIVLIILLLVTIHLTKIGFYLKAAGKSDISLTLSQVNVFKVRYIATIIGTMLMTLAGAISVIQEKKINFLNCNGLIAYALVTLGRWTIFWSIIFSYFMTIILQIANWKQIESNQWWWKSIVYLFPLFIMMFFSWSKKNDAKPEMINKPYIKEVD